MKLNRALLIFVLILVVSKAYGLGIAPARSNIEFKQDTQEGAIRIILDEIPSEIRLTKEGELGKYITLEKEVLILEDAETWIHFKINLPADLPPGERSGGIMVMQLPKDSSQENIVVATPAVVHQIRVNVPYPGKYLTGKMFITNDNIENPAVFTIALANYGKEKIENAKATIVIKGPTNEELSVLQTGTISIDANQEQKLIATWQAENPGVYYAEATVEYDSKILNLAQAFNVGNLDIEIDRIEVNNFKIGQIAKLDIYLRNKWNKPLKVDGRVEIFNKNKLISSFNALPVNILEKSTSIMEAFWNTEGIEIGEYNILVNASYEGKTSQKIFSTYVSADNIQFKDILSGQVTAKKEGQNITLLGIAVFVLIIINVLLFIYINKKLKSKPQQ